MKKHHLDHLAHHDLTVLTEESQEIIRQQAQKKDHR